MPNRFRPRSGRRAPDARRLLLLGAALALGCNYGFQGGGGFPEHIRTLYVEPFENQTAQFDLEQQVFAAVLREVPRALGLRPGGREVADAILRARITSYDDAALNTRPDGGARGGLEVLTHQVRIGLSIQIIDVERNLILFEESVSGQAEYLRQTESETDARAEAIQQIVQRIVDGAQSQW